MESVVNQRNDKLLSKKIDEEVKKFGILKTAFTKIADSELSLSKTRTGCFESISKIEETDNKYLKDIYLLFHGTMTDLEKLRKTQLDKVNSLIIPATVAYPIRVRQFNSNLERLGAIKKSKDKQLSEITKAQTKKDFEKVGKLNSEVKKHEDDERLEGNKVENGLADFESERLTDNKYLLLHYIHSELAFHATALEKLTKLYGEIMCHDPKEMLPDFINNYNLNSLKETNIANKYGFTPGDTARKLDRLKNANQPIVATGQARGMVTLNPSPKPLHNSKSLINRLEDDPTEKMNTNFKSSQSTVGRSNFQNAGNIKSNQLGGSTFK